MAYNEYTFRHRLLETHTWYRLYDLVRILNAVKFKPMHVKASRDLIRRMLDGLRVDIPFGQAVRFVDGELFVDVNNGVMARLFQQLYGSLDQNTRTEEKRGLEGRAEERSMSANDDSKVAFMNSISEILIMVDKLQLGCVSGIYDRETFEREYSLIWDEPAAPNIAQVPPPPLNPQPPRRPHVQPQP